MLETFLVLAILAIARQYDVSEQYMECIIYHESAGDPAAVGDEGEAIGLLQWHEDSWRFVREKMGEDPSPELRWNPIESAKTAAYAMRQLGLWHWWSTHDMCKQFLEP